MKNGCEMKGHEPIGSGLKMGMRRKDKSRKDTRGMALNEKWVSQNR